MDSVRESLKISANFAGGDSKVSQFADLPLNEFASYNYGMVIIMSLIL